MALAREALGVGRMGEHGAGEVGAADRLARRAARRERRVVDRVAVAPQELRHPLGASLAVGARVEQALEQPRVVVVDPVAEHVQVLVGPVDRRDLGRRQQADAGCGRGRERLVDPVDGVVVGEREQLDAGGDRRRHDRPGLELAVGVARVRLQIERRHGVEVYDV